MAIYTHYAASSSTGDSSIKSAHKHTDNAVASRTYRVICLDGEVLTRNKSHIFSEARNTYFLLRALSEKLKIYVSGMEESMRQIISFVEHDEKMARAADVYRDTKKDKMDNVHGIAIPGAIDQRTRKGRRFARCHEFFDSEFRPNGVLHGTRLLKALVSTNHLVLDFAKVLIQEISCTPDSRFMSDFQNYAPSDPSHFTSTEMPRANINDRASPLLQELKAVYLMISDPTNDYGFMARTQGIPMAYADSSCKYNGMDTDMVADAISIVEDLAHPVVRVPGMLRFGGQTISVVNYNAHARCVNCIERDTSGSGCCYYTSKMYSKRLAFATSADVRYIPCAIEAVVGTLWEASKTFRNTHFIAVDVDNARLSHLYWVQYSTRKLVLGSRALGSLRTCPRITQLDEGQLDLVDRHRASHITRTLVCNAFGTTMPKYDEKWWKQFEGKKLAPALKKRHMLSRLG